MFGNIGWGEFMVLLIAALVILGPERLPGAVSWVTKTMRQVRDYAGGASQQLKDELGPEFDDLRKPLSDLNQLRGMTPRAVITKHLLDGDDSIISGTFDGKPFANGSTGPSLSKQAPSSPPLAANERPPVDPDAT
ncbi:Sec-independent protein translocase protein TatB [Rhodococcus sp. AG1013]|uniref:Sec-independent protein translocase protein TatB n=1 Tax=unclassified Rhodococcus (in: high G+C Gram-positive bacteria) TaxID=192944 RepID=UPI000E0B8CA8|nr:Sec-independent protein translocase protein TatB [Rhodococcus sp. AG1013]RDI35969.1 sec-independent protein translocase protein TatB [Rhodococcus sp. AG1013]